MIFALNLLMRAYINAYRKPIPLQYQYGVSDRFIWFKGKVIWEMCYAGRTKSGENIFEMK